MSAPLDRFLACLSGPKKSGTGWTSRCPAHEDEAASLSIAEGDDGRVLLKCFAGCKVADIVRAVGLKLSDLFVPKQRGGGRRSRRTTAATAQPPGVGLTLAQYAEAKKLPVEFLRSLGCRDLYLLGRPAVAFPYHDAAGAETAVQFRIAIGGDDRFRWRKGSKATLYGLSRLDAARRRGYVTIVEGASDVQTLCFHDEPAVGLPGAGTWKEDRDAAHLDGIPVVYVVVEPDRGGAAVIEWIATSAILDRVRLVRLDDAKDPSELYLRDPAAFRAAWSEALALATPWSDVAREKLEHRRNVAWRKCSALAQDRRILDRLVEAAGKLGVVGEERLVKLTFLVVVSRFLAKVVSLVVKGPSSSGKSFTVQTVLRFVPARAFYALSAMSERSLVYSEEPLDHRMLVIYEAAGLGSDFATYLVRSLLSEGRIDYETVEKTKDGLKARRITRPGPTGLIVTTTEVSLHAENETRLISVTATDTPEQTARVLVALASTDRPVLDLSEWHALHEWLESSEHRVAIPFADDLARKVAPVAVRLRRDFGAVLALIRAHAILHQASRPRDEQGQIVATFDDYVAVRELVGDLLADGVGATVSETTRETVDAVERLCKARSGDPVAVKDVAKELKLDKSAASRRVHVALASGFLRNEEDRKGRPLRLVVGEPMPGERPILPEPEDLFGDGCAVAGQTEGEGDPLPPRPSPTCRECERPAIDGDGYCDCHDPKGGARDEF